jgi:hypothetical protein
MANGAEGSRTLDLLNAIPSTPSASATSCADANGSRRVPIRGHTHSLSAPAYPLLLAHGRYLVFQMAEVAVLWKP